MNTQSCIIWFDGQEGPLRSIPFSLKEKLCEMGMEVEIIGKEEIDLYLRGEEQELSRFILRIGYVAHLLQRNGIFTLIVFPIGVSKDSIRGQFGNFVEVWLKDKEKDSYCETEPVEVILEDKMDVEGCCNQIERTLKLLGHLPAYSESDYSPEEEEMIKKRLTDLGYL